jgi:hypothetical protein
MNKSIVLILCLTLLASFTQAQINLKKLKKAISGESLTSDEVAAGLKEALTNGVSKGSDLVSKVDGYYKNPEIKIPFPPEVRQVETKLRKIGMGGEVDKFILALNRGAEDAAKEAKPIFVSAIKQMTIQDAWGILKGEKDAATQYLKKTTTAQLTEKFKPIIKQSLERTNATKYYTNLVNAYNKLPLVEKVNPNLDDYATAKGIDGLFVMVAKEEKLIRDDPAARTSDLLKRVFSQK